MASATRMEHLMILGLAAAQIASLGAANAVACRLFISKDSIADSWQSSSLQDTGIRQETTCFKSRSKTDNGTYRFYHSDGGLSSTDAGFHWFMFKLRQPEQISSVTIRARDTRTNSEQHREALNSRAANIEVWASQFDLDFNSDHCSSKNISSILAESTWTLCGQTPSSVLSGNSLTVSCIKQEVRMILLRKNVSMETNTIKQCMNFVNMWIARVNVSVEFETPNITLPDEVKQNTSVKVRCRVNCAENVSQIRLTHMSRTLAFEPGSQTHMIELVQPSDAGSYTCIFGGVAVSSRNLRVLDTDVPPNNFGAPGIFFSAVALIGAFGFIIVFAWARKMNSSAQRTDEAAAAKSEEPDEAPPIEPRTMKLPAVASARQTDADCDDANNCTYVSLTSRDGRKLSGVLMQEMGSNSRPASDVTVYLNIVCDGH